MSNCLTSEKRKGLRWGRHIWVGQLALTASLSGMWPAVAAAGWSSVLCRVGKARLHVGDAHEHNW